MSEDEKRLLVSAKLRDAEEMLQVAAMNHQYEFYNSEVNRLYYACFHAASAALVAIGIEDVRRHEGVRNMFSLHYVKEGRIGMEWSSFYATMFSCRSSADYDNFKYYTKEQMEEMRPMVDEFITTIKTYLKTLGFE